MLLPFMTPDIDAMLTTEVVYPGVTSRPLASRGRKAAVVKNCAVRFVWKVWAHWSGELWSRCAEMASAELKSGVPAWEKRVLSSLAIPALLTRRWMPWGSFRATSAARRFTSSLLLISPGRAMMVPGPVLYCSTTLFKTSSLRPVM